MDISAYVLSLLAYAVLMGCFNYTYKKRTERTGILRADLQLGVSVSALSLQINDIGIWVVAIIPCIAFSSVAGVKAAFLYFDRSYFRILSELLPFVGTYEDICPGRKRRFDTVVSVSPIWR